MIHVRNLKKQHGALEILKGISMAVPTGEVHVIIGPSGGGKSTFLRCVNGLEPFQGGEIDVGPHRLTAQTHPSTHAEQLQKVRQTVGFVFQQFNLFPHLTVMENLTLAPMQVHREPLDSARSRAAELLDRVGLGKKHDSYPRQLSGGQQQRVAIARTLVMRPEAILFDEPTSALDPVMAGEVLAVMADLAKQGQTMIVTTHSMAFARGVASCVHVFAEGHDVENGPPESVFGDPKHEVTRSFLKEAERA